MPAVAVLLCGLMLGACSGYARVGDVGTGSAHDRMWDAMKPLPDWSGTWDTSGPSVDAGLHDCCQGSGAQVPLTAQYQAIRATVGAREQSNPGGSNLNNVAACDPAGMPGILAHPILFEYLFTPGRVTMLFDDTEVRKIYTDGRAHPSGADLAPSSSGDSIGRWQGNVLIVDTIGISPRADLFMSNGIHATRDTHVVERMFLNAQGLLQIDTSVTDPTVFEKPYVYSRTYQRVPGTFNAGCAQNNRDNGQTVDLTPPP